MGKKHSIAEVVYLIYYKGFGRAFHSLDLPHAYYTRKDAIEALLDVKGKSALKDYFVKKFREV